VLEHKTTLLGRPREAQSGDICILLVPSVEHEKAILDLQRRLRERYGGSLTRPVHITCQRFRCDLDQLELLQSDLAELCAGMGPIHLAMDRASPFFSDFRKAKLLKARLKADRPLAEFIRKIEAMLAHLGISPHYPWFPNLVTLLEGIDGHAAGLSFDPDPPFVAADLWLSRIHGPGAYQALFKRSLGEVTSPPT
jgi:hypothetical protein